MRGIEFKKPWNDIFRAAVQLEDHLNHLSVQCGGIFDKGEVWAADTTSGFIRGGSTSRNCSKEGQSIYLGEYTMLLKGRSPLYSSE